jgi:hypothetical protein
MKKLFIILITAILLFGINYEELFKDEINKGNMEIEIDKSSYANFDLIGGFADGKYKLQDYKIIRLRPHIYKLSLIFKKKKKRYSLKQKVEMFFYKDKKKIVFLTAKGKYSFLLPLNQYSLQKTKEGYIFSQKRGSLLCKIPVANGEIFLMVLID